MNQRYSRISIFDMGRELFVVYGINLFTHLTTSKSSIFANSIRDDSVRGVLWSKKSQYLPPTYFIFGAEE